MAAVVATTEIEEDAAETVTEATGVATIEIEADEEDHEAIHAAAIETVAEIAVATASAAAGASVVVTAEDSLVADATEMAIEAETAEIEILAEIEVVRTAISRETTSTLDSDRDAKLSIA